MWNEPPHMKKYKFRFLFGDGFQRCFVFTILLVEFDYPITQAKMRIFCRALEVAGTGSCFLEMSHV